MKRYISLTITVFIIASILLTGCGSSSETVSKQDLQELADCFSSTKNVDSMEIDVTSDTEAQGQSISLTMNMKAEDLKKDMKCKVTMDMAKQHQEYYLSINGKTTSVYMSDASGKFSVSKADTSTLGNTDITGSLNNYVDLIENNPGYFNKKSDKTYQLDVPNEEITDFYSKITGKAPGVKLSSFGLEFVIGDDGYLQNVNLTAKADSVDIKLNTKYFNYNKKFNIVLPDVSE